MDHHPTEIDKQDADVGLRQYHDGRALGSMPAGWIAEKQGLGKAKVVSSAMKGRLGSTRGSGIKDGVKET